MRVEIRHELGESEAIRRVDEFLDDLVRRDFHGGVKIKNATRSWTGNRLALSCTLAKGLFDTRLSGTVEVTDRIVTLDTVIPGLLATFVGEDRVRTVVEHELTPILGAK